MLKRASGLAAAGLAGHLAVDVSQVAPGLGGQSQQVQPRCLDLSLPHDPSVSFPGWVHLRMLISAYFRKWGSSCPGAILQEVR